MIKKAIHCVLTCLAISWLMSGCAFSPPQAWEKELLSMPEMSLNGSEGRVETHIYTSKENSRGNGILGLGGCGCN
jgi:hypothetical protein